MGTCPPGEICEREEVDVDGGVEVPCTCVPDSGPICQPDPSGMVCEIVPCPDPTEKCSPAVIFIDGSTGLAEIDTCECIQADECHPEIDIVSGEPTCVGICPPGMICERQDTDVDGGVEVRCLCIDEPPPMCEPEDDGMGCKSVQCPDGISVCQPKCVRVNADGTMEVTSCECQPGADCFVNFGPPTGIFCDGKCPPDFRCVEDANGYPGHLGLPDLLHLRPRARRLPPRRRDGNRRGRYHKRHCHATGFDSRCG